MSSNDRQRLLTKIWEMEAFLRKHPEMKHLVLEMVETYRICRQRNYGDVYPDVTKGASFEEMYKHMYVKHGGCQWCQKRIKNLEKQKLNESKELINTVVHKVENEQINKL